MVRLIGVALLTLGARALLGGVPSSSFTKSGVSLDGSLGAKVPLLGPNYMIPAVTQNGTPLARQIGTNLFYSFSEFDLTSKDTATFAGPSNIQNILSRVTSGSPSSIDGTIRSDIQGANLFFLNPAGVMFGPHAQLDVSGSVAITTADYVTLASGVRFNANLGGTDFLTSAPVAAFGFLKSTPAPVSIVGSNTFTGGMGPPNGFPIMPGLGLTMAPELETEF